MLHAGTTYTNMLNTGIISALLLCLIQVLLLYFFYAKYRYYLYTFMLKTIFHYYITFQPLSSSNAGNKNVFFSMLIQAEVLVKNVIASVFEVMHRCVHKSLSVRL